MSLEDKVESKESKGFMKKALKLGWKLGMAGATTALSMAVLPAVGASAFLGVAVGGAFAAGGAARMHATATAKVTRNGKERRMN